MVEGRAPLGTQNLDPEKTARYRHISELLVEQDTEEKVFPLFNFKVIERGRSSDVLYSPRFQTLGSERNNQDLLDPSFNAAAGEEFKNASRFSTGAEDPL